MPHTPSPRIHQWLIPLLLGLAASLAVLLDLTLRGPIAWHFSMPAAIQGGIEALLLAALMAALAWRGGRAAWITLAIVVALYLRRHHVDLAVIGTLFAAEAYIALGRCTGVKAGQSELLWSGLRAWLAGIVLWLVVMLGLHALGLAHSHTLLLGFAALGTLAMVLNRRSELVLPGLRAFASEPAMRRAGWAVLVAWLLVLMARSNSVLGYDAIWYPARGSVVLAPNGSAFEHLGLVAPVHYFPKLWELLILPLDAIDDFSFIVGHALIFMLAGLAACGLLLRRLGMPAGLMPIALITMATVPAIASTALLFKTDMAAFALLMFALLAASRWATFREAPDLLWAASGIGLACCAKLTVLPYAGLLAIALCVSAYQARRALSPRGLFADRGATLAGTLTLVVGLVMLYRTWALSGMPTIGPDPLVKLWNSLGMSLREPVGSLDWLKPQDWADAPWLLPEALFAPSGLPKIVISWIGNVWLLAALLVWWWGGSGTQQHRLQTTLLLRRNLWIMSLAGLVLLLAWRYQSRGSDGNYFIVPMVAACLLAFAAAARSANNRAKMAGLSLMLAVCALWQASLGFVTAGWSPPGTRTLDLDFTRSAFDRNTRLQSEIAKAGLMPFAEILARAAADSRTISAGRSWQAHMLPTRVEAMEHIWSAHTEYVAGTVGFSKFLRVTCIDHVLLLEGDPMAELPYVRPTVESFPNELLLRRDGWSLYRIKPCEGTAPAPL